MKEDEENFRGLGISKQQYLGLLFTLCQQGGAEGQYLLGELFEEGKAIERDMEEALALYRLSAEQGFAKAQHRLGFIYFMGRVGAQNVPEGVQLMRRAAEQGFAMSLFGLGMAHLAGRGAERNVELALDYLRRAASGGYEAAAKMLAGIELEGVHPQEVYAAMFEDADGPDARLKQAYRLSASADAGEQREAFRIVREVAETGHGKGCFLLACMYRDGRCTERNEREFADWLYRAAEAGFAEAQDYMGDLYAAGECVEQDAAAAAYWRSLAAEQGLARAQFSLAQQYGSGSGVAKDPQQMMLWLLRAAEQGHTEAQFRLGLGYASGEDYRKAAEWFSEAVAQQYWPAMVCLAVLYAAGKGVPLSREKAELYNRMAAEHAAEEERLAWFDYFVALAHLSV